MRIKAFLWVLACAVLMMGLNATAGLAGDWLKGQASAAIYQQALGDVPEASALTLPELMRDPDYSARLLAANRQVTNEYAWYLRAVFALQTVLLLLLAWVCSQVLLRMGRRQALQIRG